MFVCDVFIINTIYKNYNIDIKLRGILFYFIVKLKYSERTCTVEVIQMDLRGASSYIYKPKNVHNTSYLSFNY